MTVVVEVHVDDGPTRPAPKIKMDLVWVDKAEAERLLGTIKKQRVRRRGHVASLSADMKHNRWQDSHQAIALNDKGELIDGQHRLASIAETGLGQWLWIATGVSQQAMGVIDTSATRSAADALKLGEVVSKNHPIVAATARIAILWTEDHHQKVRIGVNGARKVSNGEIAEYVEEQIAAADQTLPITQAVADARGWTGITAKTAMSPSVVAFALLMTASVSYADAYEFFTALDKGDWDADNPNDPVHQLFDRENLAVMDGTKGMRISEHLFLIFTAWNAWRKGEGVKFVTMTAGGKLKPTKVMEPTKNKAGIVQWPIVPIPE